MPVAVSIAGASFATSLFPKDGGYLLPLKAAVRAQAGIALGDSVCVRMRVARRRLTVRSGEAAVASTNRMNE